MTAFPVDKAQEVSTRRDNRRVFVLLHLICTTDTAEEQLVSRSGARA
jgi:hypothetical protein